MYIAVINKIWCVRQFGTTSFITKCKDTFGGVLLFVSFRLAGTKISLNDNNSIAFCIEANDSNL